MRLLALIVLLSCGCGAPATDEEVELVHQDFCWGDCPDASSDVRGARVAAGARYVVRVQNARRLPPFAVSTSDDSVLSLASAASEEGDAEHPETLVLEAGAAGHARLMFHDLAGELIDEAELEVVEPASLARFRRPPEPLRLMLGGAEVFYIEIHDDDGQPLVGYGAIEYAATAGTIQDARAQATALDDAAGWSVAVPESVAVTATSAGVTTINARAGDASLTFEIEVVDSSAVSRIQVIEECGLGCTGRAVQAHAFTADGDEILDPECDWSWSSAVPDWRVDRSRNALRLTGEDDLPEFEVTCSIGEVSASSWL